MYPSPMADGGYDVSDYEDVAPRFGTLADADALIGAAHDRGLKLLFDANLSPELVQRLEDLVGCVVAGSGPPPFSR